MNRLAVTAATNIGRRREVNEDRVVVGPWILAPGATDVVSLASVGGISIVAVLDGMGGHAGGEIAAATAAEVIGSYGGILGSPDAVGELVDRANAAVYARMEKLPQLAGMGTTIAGLSLSGDQVIVFNVGDARVYAERDGYLLQASVDDAVASGALTQSLGGRSVFEPVTPHVITEAAKGRFLVASDGLFGHIEDVELEKFLTEDDEASARALLRAALDAGGPDNVSFALVSVIADGFAGGAR